MVSCCTLTQHLCNISAVAAANHSDAVSHSNAHRYDMCAARDQAVNDMLTQHAL